jgi:hypothetical protein
MAGRSGALLRGGLVTLPPGRQVGMLAGARSMGLGKLFSNFDGLNDGTVMVWETRMVGLADHAVIQSSHSGLVFSEQVADLTAAFLEFGRFRPCLACTAIIRRWNLGATPQEFSRWAD